MKLTIHTQHRDFYLENHYVEFEGILSPREIEELKEALNEAFASRLNCRPQMVEKKAASALFEEGHDLWRSSLALKKIEVGPKFPHIAHELIQVKPLRLAFDQYFPSGASFASDLTFAEISCIRGLLCGVLVHLSGEKAGNGIYIAPEYVFKNNPEDLNRYLLIAYSHSTSLFTLNENDSHVHSLRRFGYNFGDRLNDKKHPLIHQL